MRIRHRIVKGSTGTVKTTHIDLTNFEFKLILWKLVALHVNVCDMGQMWKLPIRLRTYIPTLLINELHMCVKPFSQRRSLLMRTPGTTSMTTIVKDPVSALTKERGFLFSKILGRCPINWSTRTDFMHCFYFHSKQYMKFDVKGPILDAKMLIIVFSCRRRNY